MLPLWTEKGNFQPRPKKSITSIIQPPIKTVPAATTLPAGRSAGSLHVSAGSLFLAAIFPLIFTLALPAVIFP
ncbi:hypothetical protein D3C81_2019700 [compost metagenome]